MIQLSGKQGAYVVGGAVAVAAVLAFIGLSNHMFWDDEALTAIYARNLLKTGTVTAWDGNNVVAFNEGKTLDNNLIEVFSSYLQFYTAAIGFYIFGETTFAGRVMFVLAGLLTLPLLALWARRYFDVAYPWWLPPAILALSPAYLLYIRQCRYYALAVMFTVGLWLAWSYGQRDDDPHDGKLLSGSWRDALTSPRQWLRCAAGALMAQGLLSSHYLDAAAALAVLAVWLILERRNQNTRQIAFLAFLALWVGTYGVWVLMTNNPLAMKVNPDDPAHPVVRYLTLMWWHIRDLGPFEFMPVALVPLLGLPWARSRLKAHRALAIRACVLIVAMLVYMSVAAVFSVQIIDRTRVADMRYIFPLIVMCALITTCVIVILWSVNRWFSALVLAAAVFSNALHLSYLFKQPLRSTIVLYVQENLNDYETGTEAIIKVLKVLPPGTKVWMFPNFVVYPPMFYADHIRYCGLLSVEKELAPSLRAVLPDHVFAEKAVPDLLMMGAGTADPQLAVEALNQKFGPGAYIMLRYLPVCWRDTTRPEIPWRRFTGPTEEMNRSFGWVLIASAEWRQSFVSPPAQATPAIP